MTCIVGIRHAEGITIAGDSAGVDWRLGLQIRRDEKVFARTDENGVQYLFGYTSSFRMGQLLRYKLELPEVVIKAESAHEFMATRFVDALRACLKAGGWMKIENSVEEAGAFLVGVRGHLFEIQPDLQVAIPVTDYLACGCGDQIALGSLHAQFDAGFDGKGYGTIAAEYEAATRKALAAAEAHCAGVRSPFIALSGASA